MDLNSCIKEEKWNVNADGILVEDNTEEINSRFSEELQDGLFVTEDGSWWFLYRAQVIGMLAARYLKRSEMTFDIGGGNGFTTKQLELKGYSMVLMEPTYKACLNAKKRGLKTIVCGTVDEESVRDGSLPQCMILDVLEHIEKDGEFLKLLHQKAAPGGRVLITVPAFPVLWSSEDTAAGHFRRYKRKQLRELAESAGFSVLYENYFFEFLFLPVLIIRVGLERLGILKSTEQRSKAETDKIMERQFKQRKGIVGHVLGIFEKAELIRLKKGRNIRFGSSIICILEKV